MRTVRSGRRSSTDRQRWRGLPRSRTGRNLRSWMAMRNCSHGVRFCDLRDPENVCRDEGHGVREAVFQRLECDCRALRPAPDLWFVATRRRQSKVTVTNCKIVKLLRRNLPAPWLLIARKRESGVVLQTSDSPIKQKESDQSGGANFPARDLTQQRSFLPLSPRRSNPITSIHVVPARGFRRAADRKGWHRAIKIPGQ